MIDEHGRDDKLICVPLGDPRLEHLRDIYHLPEFERFEMQHFFEVYKQIEPGKSVRGDGWAGRNEAEAEIAASFARTHHAAAKSRREDTAPGESGCGT